VLELRWGNHRPALGQHRKRKAKEQASACLGGCPNSPAAPTFVFRGRRFSGSLYAARGAALRTR
jgi:hypothetical protein